MIGSLSSKTTPKKGAALRKALLILLAVLLVSGVGLAIPATDAFGDSVRFTSWKNTMGLIQGQGDHGRRIQSANYHATTDGRVAYCYAQGSYEPYDDVAYHCIGEASTRAAVILENGWPATNTIGGVALSDDEARQATQVALWMLGDYGYKVPYSSLSGTYDDNGVQVGRRAAAAAKALYDWSSGRSTSASYKIYNESVAGKVYQVMVVAEKSEGYVELRKASSIPAASEGNAGYSLEGAVYGVYADASCTSLAARLTTDSSGYAKSDALTAGTYYVREISAPKGYELSQIVHTAQVPSGGTASLNVKDEPLVERPAEIALKVDGETRLDAPQGSASLAGAQFEVSYWTGLFGTPEEARASGEADRTWVLQSDERGRVSFSDESLVSGDELFRDADEKPVLPLGTVVVREAKAPEGYLASEDEALRQVRQDGEEWQAPVFEEQVVRGGLSIAKSLAGGSVSELEGIEFRIVNASKAAVTVEGASYEPGETVTTLVLDAEGLAESAASLLPYGSYEVVEVAESVPENIIPYADAQGSGSSVVAVVTLEDGASYHEHVYRVELENYKKPAFSLVKVDGDSISSGNEEGALPVAGSEWLLEYEEGGTWTEVERGSTDENGVLAFSDQAVSRWGTYRLTETRAAREDESQGYLPRKDSDMPASVTFSVDESTWEKIAAGTYEGVEGDSWAFEMRDGTPALVRGEHNWLKRSIEALKTDQDTGAPVAGTEFTLYRWIGEGEPGEQAQGEKRAERHEAYEADPAEEIDPALWQKIEAKTSSEDGSALFEGLAFGSYLLVESRPSEEYAEWWESELSTWDRYQFTCDDESGQHQLQVFGNDRIELETTVDKSTIQTTSAAFASLEGQPVSFDNVNMEEYRYDLGFSNGSTNVRADQYTVVDSCEFVALGARLTRLWTPVTTADSDGLFNLWYKTNLCDEKTVYSEASATKNNPENMLSDGSDRISTKGWRLWKEGLSTSKRTPLSAADLKLEEDEHITGLMLEYGSVKPGFKTEEPLTYLVSCSERIELQDGEETLIENSATSHITRNWKSGTNGSGLRDDADDKVATGVLGTFAFKFDERSMAQTGDAGVPLWLAALAGTSALAAATVGLSLRRDKPLRNRR